LDSIAARDTAVDGGSTLPDEILTVQEIAILLKLADKTVYSMAQVGELPAFKVRGQWRIRRVDFDAWMERQARNRPRTQKK
jgi:excisionase family DNA binding protein